MGYFTTFSLTAQQDTKEIELTEEMKLAFIESSKDLEETDVEELFDGYLNAKWYEYESDMQDFSKKFPKILFTVDGAGENGSYIWRHYFLNGKSQRDEAQIVFEGFNPELLS